ncbi:MAG: hypothetical protein KatS3mg110_3643 [Pirellulaceae bacterium]|nr:MAG: hypothetical protein KatS3mg110_3643 [Pirellulaceae bacterium]
MCRLRCCCWLAACLVLGGNGCRSLPPGTSVARQHVEWSVERSYQSDYSVVEALPGEASASWSEPQPLERFVQRALEQNPQIHAADQRVEAAAAMVVEAGSLEDPMLAVNGWPFFPFVPQTAAGMMTAEIMVEQRVPWKGKLAARAAAAAQELEAARAQRAALELEIVEQVKRAYYQLQTVERTIDTLQKDRATLETLVQVALARYQASQATQQEVLRLQAELDQVDSQLAEWARQRETARADLAQLLHLSPDTPFVTAATAADPSAPAELDELYRRAVAMRPELHAQLAEIQKERYQAQLARLDYFPDTNLRAGWAEMTTRRALSPVADGLDMVTVGLSVNLPIYQPRLDAAVRRADANVVWAAREYDRLRDQTLRDVKQRFAEATAQRQIIQLLRDGIIPKTEQAYQVAVQGYQAGTVSFADMLAVWRELLRYHILLEQTEGQYRQTLASLERLVGGLLPEAPGHPSTTDPAGTEP